MLALVAIGIVVVWRWLERAERLAVHNWNKVAH